MLKETTYTPQGASKGFIPYLEDIFTGFKEGHRLGKQLFIRDKKAAFRGSFIGIVWAFIPPFITAFLMDIPKQFEYYKSKYHRRYAFSALCNYGHLFLAGDAAKYVQVFECCKQRAGLY